ncbi:MAG: family 16 glycosylhydrolase [Sedimentisphaerales bacterium]|nr:family 16 glycosylhydrolase [Sedimentisphaerales bacterium]
MQPHKRTLFCLLVAGGILLAAGRPLTRAAFRGDLDGDGYVTLLDLELLIQNWTESGPAAPGDLDGSGRVDLADYAILMRNWQQSRFITASASSSEGSAYPASRAIDGDFATRWSSAFADDQWLRLDLGHTRTVSGLELYWEAAYARDYAVDVSLDGSDWITVHQTGDGDGDYDRIDFAPQPARYLRLRCLERATDWGFSLWEVFVEADDVWSLLWEDPMDGFDPSRWQRASHTWNENLAQFTPANVTFADGRMKLLLTNEPTGSRSYSGAEYRTIESYRYGKFVVRMKAAPGSGVISSFFTYRDPPNDPTWNEIDIEFLGKDTTEIHCNHWWGWWPNQDPTIWDLPYAADQEFHEYSFEWQPHYVRWSVDGVACYVATENVPWLAQKIMMNIWISSSVSWAGPFDPAVLPVRAEYDYVRYYRNNCLPE